VRYFRQIEAHQKLGARVRAKVALHQVPVGTTGTVAEVDGSYGGPDDYGVWVSWDLPSDRDGPKRAWFSFDGYLSQLSELTAEGVPDREHEAAAQRATAKEFDRAYYHRVRGTVVQGAALLGQVAGGITGFVVGWRTGGEPIGYLVLGVGGMVAGGFVGKHASALLAHMLMHLLLVRYRHSFRRDYGEDL
jgi:hypothetical protein